MVFPRLSDFAVFNQTGITVSDAPVGRPTASGRRVRFDTNGNLSYEADVFTFFSMTSTLGANAYVTGSTLSNTASTWLAGEFIFSAFASGNASGNLVLYLEESPDAGTTWPSPASANGPGGGMIVAVLGYGSVANVASTASTTRVINFDL